MNLDLQILHFFNGWTNHNHLLDLLFIFLANYLVYVFSAVALLYWFWHPVKETARKAVVMAFVSFVIARLIITEIIRAAHPRQRPVIAHPIVDFSQKQSEPSFPSGHAAAMFSIATAIYFYDKRLGGWLFVMSILTGIARIVTGVHFPSDILGGIILGCGTAWVLEKTAAQSLGKTALRLSEFSDRLFSFTKPG